MTSRKVQDIFKYISSHTIFNKSYLQAAIVKKLFWILNTQLRNGFILEFMPLIYEAFYIPYASLFLESLSLKYNKDKLCMKAVV